MLMSCLLFSFYVLISDVSYTLLLASLLVKITKASCLEGNLGTRQNRVPRWSFGIIFFTPVLVLSAVVYLSWIFGDHTEIMYHVTTLDAFVTHGESITIEWLCKFDR